MEGQWWRLVRQPFNAASHFCGAILAVPATVALVQNSPDPQHMATFLVYGATLVALYTASALYHGLPLSEGRVEQLRSLDHACIFLLIAGSYTPVCLITLRGRWGEELLAVVWLGALGGVAIKRYGTHLPHWLTRVALLTLGWGPALLVVEPLWQRLPVGGILTLFGGGVAYTVGALIDTLERPAVVRDTMGHHEAFHVCTLAGSALHYAFMAYYVAPGR